MKILNRTDKTRVEWTANGLVRRINEGEVLLDNAVQRGYVWDTQRESLLVESLILENPIPPIYAAKYGETYSLIDGKQRSTAISRFLSGEFSLEGLEPFETENEEGGVEEIDLNGMTFADLPGIFQDAIKESTLTVIVMNDPTEDEICDIFFKLNNG